MAIFLDRKKGEKNEYTKPNNYFTYTFNTGFHDIHAE